MTLSPGTGRSNTTGLRGFLGLWGERSDGGTGWGERSDGGFVVTPHLPPPADAPGECSPPRRSGRRRSRREGAFVQIQGARAQLLEPGEVVRDDDARQAR